MHNYQKYFYFLLFLNVILVSSKSFKFSFIDQDNPQIILDYLTTKYNATATLETLDTNPVFPFHIEPEYEGRAKMLYDQIIQTKLNIEEMNRRGMKDTVKAAAQAFLKKTENEFEMIKSPYIVKTIIKTLYPLLRQSQDAYIAVIIDYITTETDLIDLVNLIMIAIINA
jgi:hypothetical protein